MRRSVGIAGCGVAGLALACLLRARGWRVVIFDKLDAPAPIGSGLILQPVGMHVLDALGVGDAMRALGAPIDRLYGLSGRRVVLDVRYDALGANAPRGLSVHRGALFQVLYDAARASGAEIVSRREVVSASDGRFGFADGTRSARFDVVVDALGMRSPLSPAPAQNLAFGALWASLDWAGDFDPAALEQRYQAARKMAGVLPIGRLPSGNANAPLLLEERGSVAREPARSGAPLRAPSTHPLAPSPSRGGGNAKAAFFWSLRHDRRAAWRCQPLDAWKHEVRALWPATAPLLDQLHAHDELVFAAYAHRTLASPVSRTVVHVGDSWHCTSPQLGQGANMALLDAYALALALARQGDLATALGEYARLRLWHIRLYQAASWLFTPAYQSDSAAIAWSRDHIVAPVSRLWPGPQVLAALVAGQWGWPLTALRDAAQAQAFAPAGQAFAVEQGEQGALQAEASRH